MYRKLARIVSVSLSERGLLGEEFIPYATYEAELIFEKSCFWLLMVVTTIHNNKCKEAVVYSLTTSILRKRMGGWHATSPIICQILSLATVHTSLLVSDVLQYMNIDFKEKHSIRLALLVVTAVMPPAYPKQLHYSQNEKLLVSIWKIIDLLILAVMQIVLIKYERYKYVLNTIMGLITADVLVVLEHFINTFRKDDSNERKTEEHDKKLFGKENKHG